LDRAATPAVCGAEICHRLGPQLRRDYGASGEYTLGQIRTPVKKCRLPAAYLSIGYAAFLSEQVFRAVADSSYQDDYAALRVIFNRYIDRGVRIEDGDPSTNMGGDVQ
jgi:hypothetical protein